MKSRGNIRYIYISLGAGLLMVIATYLLSNLSGPLSSENRILKWWDLITYDSTKYETPIPDDMLLINVSYDRELVTLYNEYDEVKGNIDVTDRAKLINFFRLANKANNYRYIICDLEFNKKYKTDKDSILWNLIRDTPRLVIPALGKLEISSPAIVNKMALAEYTSSIEEGDFTKYTMVDSEGNPSMALRAFQEISGNEHAGFCGFYFCDGKLMRRSMFLNLDLQTQKSDDPDILDLGYHILDDSFRDIQFEDKIIFIGDFYENDIHPTYKGSMHGVMIHANAFENLRRNNHLISWGVLLTLWITYSALFLFALRGGALSSIINTLVVIPKSAKRSRYWKPCVTIGRLALSFIGYSTILTALFLIIYMITGQIFEIIYLSIIFVLTSFISKNSTQ